MDSESRIVNFQLLLFILTYTEYFFIPKLSYLLKNHTSGISEVHVLNATHKHPFFENSDPSSIWRLLTNSTHHDDGFQIFWPQYYIDSRLLWAESVYERILSDL